MSYMYRSTHEIFRFYPIPPFIFPLQSKGTVKEKFLFFRSIVSFRHGHKFNFGCSDIYIIVALKPVSSEINKCTRELSDCRWMPVQVWKYIIQGVYCPKKLQFWPILTIFDIFCILIKLSLCHSKIFLLPNVVELFIFQTIKSARIEVMQVLNISLLELK